MTTVTFQPACDLMYAALHVYFPSSLFLTLMSEVPKQRDRLTTHQCSHTSTRLEIL